MAMFANLNEAPTSMVARPSTLAALFNDFEEPATANRARPLPFWSPIAVALKRIGLHLK